MSTGVTHERALLSRPSLHRAAHAQQPKLAAHSGSRFDRLPYVMIIGREDGEERTLFVRLVDRGRFASGYGYRIHPMDGGAGGTRASAHSPNSAKGLAASCDL
jgi:hypothetical protein